MSTKKTAEKATEKKEFTLKQVFALWRKKSKKGNFYFTGVCDESESYLSAFYNTKKANPKEPDIRVYKRDQEGNLEKEEFVSLWCNVTKNGKKLLSGKIDGKRVIGFINAKADEKHPYISVYWSDTESEAKPAEKATKKNEKEETNEDDLPF